MARDIGKKVDFLSYLAAGISVLAIVGNYAEGNLVLMELLFFLFFLAQSVGLILRKEWARSMMTIGAAVAVFYGTLVLLFTSFGRPAALHLAFFGAVMMIAYTHPAVRAVFAPSADALRCSVLLIDDDRSFSKMLKTRLAKRGIVLLHAETGEKGLRQARDWQPDLILLDVILPGIKGRDVCVQLKRDDRTRQIPVIFLTAKDSPDDIMAEMEAGAASHVTKPVDMDVLYAHIQNVLQNAA